LAVTKKLTVNTPEKITYTELKSSYEVGEKVEFEITSEIPKGTEIIAKLNTVAIEKENGKYSFSMPDIDSTIDIILTNILYNVRLINNEHVTLSLDSEKTSFFYQDVIKVIFTCDEGYELTDISAKAKDVDIECTLKDGMYEIIMPDNDITIEATALKNYSVNIDSAYFPVTVKNKKDNYHLGDKVVFSVSKTIADTTYKFVSVEVLDKNSKNIEVKEEDNQYYFIMPDSSVSIKVSHTRRYTLKTTVGEHVSLSLDNTASVFEKDENISFSLSFDEGYELDSLSIKKMETDVPYVFAEGKYSFSMPEGNTEIKAYAKLKAVSADPWTKETLYQSEMVAAGSDYEIQISLSFKGDSTLTWSVSSWYYDDYSYDWTPEGVFRSITTPVSYAFDDETKTVTFLSTGQGESVEERSAKVLSYDDQNFPKTLAFQEDFGTDVKMNFKDVVLTLKK